jgi:hypothetical protein
LATENSIEEKEMPSGYHTVNGVDTRLLCAVAQRAIANMTRPGSWDSDCLSLNARGESEPIWSADARKFSELGHLYKAAQQELAIAPTKKAWDAHALKIMRISDLIDAQVRRVMKDQYGNSASLVTLATQVGRLAALEALSKVVHYLSGGGQIMMPHEVGVHAGIVLPQENDDE